jgi:hypothetical protein
MMLGRLLHHNQVGYAVFVYFLWQGDSPWTIRRSDVRVVRRTSRMWFGYRVARIWEMIFLQQGPMPGAACLQLRAVRATWCCGKLVTIRLRFVGCRWFSDLCCLVIHEELDGNSEIRRRFFPNLINYFDPFTLLPRRSIEVCSSGSGGRWCL